MNLVWLLPCELAITSLYNSVSESNFRIHPEADQTHSSLVLPVT